MPQPTPSDVHVSAPLTNILVAYLQDDTNFVARRAFPIVPVAKQQDLFYLYNKEDFFRDEAQVRAPSTESAGGGFTVATDSYYCPVVAFHKDVDDQLRANADSILQLDAAATRLVGTKLQIKLEKQWLAAFFTTGVWTGDTTPNPLWSAANSDPMKDVEVGKTTIKGATGYKPNKLIISDAVFSALRTNQAVKDQFKYTSADSINEAMLARYFDIDELIVAGAVNTTSLEGNATQTTVPMAGKHALLLYTPPGPSILAPSAGYTFAWSGYVGAADGVRITRFRQENIKSDRIEGESAFATKKVAASLGYFLNGVIS